MTQARIDDIARRLADMPDDVKEANELCELAVRFIALAGLRSSVVLGAAHDRLCAIAARESAAEIRYPLESLTAILATLHNYALADETYYLSNQAEK